MFISKDLKVQHAVKIIDKFLIYIVMSLFILEGPTVYRNATAGFIDGHSMIVYAIKIVTIIFVSLLLLTQILKYDINKQMLKKWAILCVIYYCIIVVEFLATFSTADKLNFIYYFGGLLPALFTITFLKMNNREVTSVFYAFSNIMLVIACISLFFWFFGSFLGTISTNEYIEADWGGIFQYPSYLGIYFERQTIDVFGQRIFRNEGIFLEAPMYNAYLVVALCVEVYMRPWKRSLCLKGEYSQIVKKLNVPRVIVLFITIITTLTTSGIVFALAIGVSMFFLCPTTRKHTFWIKVCVGIILFISAIILGVYVLIDKSESMSFKTRVDDFYACFSAWKTSPVFGTGIMNDSSIVEHMSSFRLDNVGIATGIGKILAQGGVVLISVYLVPIIYIIVKTIKYRNWEMLCFSVMFGVLLITAIIEYTAICLLVLSIGYAAILIDFFDKKNSIAYMQIIQKKEIHNG